MKSLLHALNDGRLIELPDNDKESCLEVLATLIEAIPDLHCEEGITERVLARERSHNTGIGSGWACPHARSSRDGELVCSVGWSPAGIDYGSADGASVRLIVMYFVPDTEKNAYLKEISLLAKAIHSMPALRDLAALEDLADVRHRLLDAITVAMESTAPEARARMIQLAAKQAALEQPPGDADGADVLRLLPFSFVSLPGSKPLVLGQDDALVTSLEGDTAALENLVRDGHASAGGYRMAVRSSSHFKSDRVLYDCIAFPIKAAGV